MQDCGYCGASFEGREAYVRHLATAHESTELSRIDARLVAEYEARPAFAEGRERLRSALDGPAALGTMRLPIGRLELLQLAALACLATLAAGGVLAL